MKEIEKYMNEAFLEAKKAYNMNEVPVGAIVVCNKKIISKAHNMSEFSKNFTYHAELLALNKATKIIDSKYLNNCELYVTKEPCMMCIGAIINARIQNVFYGLPDTEFGFNSVKNNLNMKMNHLNHVHGKILKDECQKIIQDFFLKKR